MKFSYNLEQNWISPFILHTAFISIGHDYLPLQHHVAVPVLSGWQPISNLLQYTMVT